MAVTVTVGFGVAVIVTVAVGVAVNVGVTVSVAVGATLPTVCLGCSEVQAVITKQLKTEGRKVRRTNLNFGIFIRTLHFYTLKILHNCIFCQ